MKKKVLSAVLAATMVAGMMGNVVSVSAEEKYDLTLYSVNTTDPDFDDWLANVERNGELQQVDPEEVKVGDIIIVRPGERDRKSTRLNSSHLV